jgi:hypothetical protein
MYGPARASYRGARQGLSSGRPAVIAKILTGRGKGSPTPSPALSFIRMTFLIPPSSLTSSSGDSPGASRSRSSGTRPSPTSLLSWLSPRTTRRPCTSEPLSSCIRPPTLTCSYSVGLNNDHGVDVLGRYKQIFEESKGDKQKQAKLTEELITHNSDLVKIPGLWPFCRSNMYEVDFQADTRRHVRVDPCRQRSVFLPTCLSTQRADVPDSPADLVPRIYTMGTHAPQWFDGMIIGWPKVFGADLEKGFEAGVVRFESHPGWARMTDLAVRFQEQVCHLSGRLLVAPVCRRRMVGRRRSGGLQDVPSPFAWSQRHLHKVEFPLILRGVNPTHVISFGSALFPPTLEQLRVLLDVLEELQCRYIIVEGNGPDEIKKTLRDRVGKGKDKGLLVPWAPQRVVLAHPVSDSRS